MSEHDERHVLQIIMEEVQDPLIALLVCLLNLRIGQITSGSHEAVDLIRECLNMLGDLQCLLVLLDFVRGLITRRNNSEGDLDVLAIVGVDHGWMYHRSSAEDIRRSCSHNDDFTTPAVTKEGPFLDGWVFGLSVLDQLGNTFDFVRGGALGLEEVAQFFFLIVVAGWIPGDVSGFVAEPIGYEDLVLVFFIRVGEDVRALDGLRPETEDVVDDQDAGIRAIGTGFV